MDEQSSEDIDRLLVELDPQHIPEEFVTAARVTYEDEEVKVLTPDELEEIMFSGESLRDQGILDVRLMLDLNLIKETIWELSEIILSSVSE
jgi:hypothetical protein